jgi:hypothetical protein
MDLCQITMRERRIKYLFRLLENKIGSADEIRNELASIVPNTIVEDKDFSTCNQIEDNTLDDFLDNCQYINCYYSKRN